MIDYKKEAARIVTLSAVEANFLLSLNTDNRKFTMSRVVIYMDEINKGRFAFNGESIIVSKDGVLMDGQHRLLALSKTDKKIKVVLVTGIDNKEMVTIDTGSKRTAADILSINKFANSTVLAAMSKLVIREFGLNKKHIYSDTEIKGKIVKTKVEEAITPEDILEDVTKHYKNYSEAVNFAESLYASVSSVRLKGLSVSSIAAYFVLFSRDNVQDARSFLREVLTGSSERDSNAATLLRNRLINLNIKRENISSEKLRDLMIAAFNKYKFNELVKTLKVGSGSFIKKDRV